MNALRAFAICTMALAGLAAIPSAAGADTGMCNGKTATNETTTPNGSAFTSDGVVVSYDSGTNTTTITGTDGDDVIVGTLGNDSIEGRGGNDSICARKGDDTVGGNLGDDYLAGGDGNNTIYGGGGNDTIVAFGGTDNLFGGSGDDTINAGGGNDSLRGDAGNDNLFGEGGNDTLDGDNPAPYYAAGTSDVCDGGSGVDTADPTTCETINNVP